jgi:hypothetical protein
VEAAFQEQRPGTARSKGCNVELLMTYQGPNGEPPQRPPELVVIVAIVWAARSNQETATTSPPTTMGQAPQPPTK